MTQEEMPKPDKGLVGWMYRYARRHAWRTYGWYEPEDLIADGYMVYATCYERYVRSNKSSRFKAATSPKHFMALYKLCFISHVGALAQKAARQREVHLDGGTPERTDALWDKLLGTEDGMGTLLALVEEAPKEVRAAVELLLTERGRRLLRQPLKRGRYGERETTNQWLCRMLGLDPNDIDLAGMIRAHFSS